LRKLDGFAALDFDNNVFLDETFTFTPQFYFFDGFVDDEGFLILFAIIKDKDNNRIFLGVAYVSEWQSDQFTDPSDVKTIKDALHLEWLNGEFALYSTQETDAFFSLYEQYNQRVGKNF
jgi:hypothetical protein